MLKRQGSRQRSWVRAVSDTAFFMLGFGSLFALESWAAVKLSAPQFKSGGAGGTVTLRGDADFTAVKDEQAKDNQVVFEITGAKLEPGADLEVPTSSFAGSKLKLLKAYSVAEKPDTVRLVLQLTEAAPVEMKQEGKTLTLLVGAGAAAGAAPTATAAPKTESAPQGSAEKAGGEASPPSPVQESASAASASPSTDATPKALDAPTDLNKSAADSSAPPADVPTTEEGKQIQALVDARAAGRFSGRPISIQVRDAELGDVLNLIAEASGFNIILSEGVKGKVSLSLVDVPWDQALDVVLRTKKLTAERSHNVLRVLTFEELTSEKQAELQAARVSRAAAQKVYRIFRPAYVTDLDSLKTRMVSIVNASSPGAGTEGASTPGTSTGGTITVDSRTNSLIVYDAPETLEMMAKILKYLDRPIAQVLIESRIVEASENFGKSLGGQLGAIGAQGGVAFNGDPSISGFLGSTGAGLGLGGQTPASIAIAAQPSISFIPGFNRLSAILQLSETEKQIRTVSNPRTVTLEDSTSSVRVTTPILIPGGAPSTGQGAPGNLPAAASLSLSMRPKVLADGSVKLESLSISADDPVGSTGISSRNIATNVVVENGSTLMVGGVFKNIDNFEATGIPLLRNIPLLGWLFGSEGKTSARSELLFFVTPRVLNEKDFGIGKATVNL